MPPSEGLFFDMTKRGTMDGNLSFHNLLQDEGQTGFKMETLNRVNVRNTVHVNTVSLINKQLLSIRCL